jgi:hypothetical protein
MIGTVIDALNEGSLSSSSAVNLVLVEAGAVSLKDVELAKESKASIFTYGLENCTKDVLKEAKVYLVTTITNTVFITVNVINNFSFVCSTSL